MQTIIIIDEKTGKEITLTGVDNISAHDFAKDHIKNPAVEVDFNKYLEVSDGGERQVSIR